MSRRYWQIEGKTFNFTYKKGDGEMAFLTSVFLGENLICLTSRTGRTFHVIVQGPLNDDLIPRDVGGFATRWDAIIYALKVHHLTAKKIDTTLKV